MFTEGYIVSTNSNNFSFVFCKVDNFAKKWTSASVTNPGCSVTTEQTHGKSREKFLKSYPVSARRQTADLNSKCLFQDIPLKEVKKEVVVVS